MSQQDVQIAFQAGFVTYELEDYTEGGYDIRYERFADLIRADERKALIHYFADHWRSDWSDGQIIEALEARGNT